MAEVVLTTEVGVMLTLLGSPMVVVTRHRLHHTHSLSQDPAGSRPTPEQPIELPDTSERLLAIIRAEVARLVPTSTPAANVKQHSALHRAIPSSTGHVLCVCVCGCVWISRQHRRRIQC